VASFFMKRRPIWKILLAAAAILAALVGSAAIWIRSAANREVAAMQTRMRALETELRVPDPARRPGSEKGNAWDDYILALVEASKVKPADKLIGILANTSNADHAFGDAALAAYGAAIDRLLQGARRATCVPPGPTRDLWNWETLGRLAVLKARKLSREGKAAEALELRLALAQFGRDLSECTAGLSFGHGLATLERAFEEIREDLLSPASTPEAIAGLQSRLADLDEAFPRPEQERRQQNHYLAEHFSRIVQYSGAGDALLSWRFGFSARLMAGTSFATWDRCFQRSMAADRLPWPEAQSRIASIRAEIDVMPILDRYGLPSGFLGDGSQGRSARAHLRLLRTAARYRQTGEMLSLDDPFGGKLLHQASEGRLKIWSVGKDGVDQSGRGNWDSRPVDDIVLDVPR